MYGLGQGGVVSATWGTVQSMQAPDTGPTAQPAPPQMRLLEPALFQQYAPFLAETIGRSRAAAAPDATVVPAPTVAPRWVGPVAGLLVAASVFTVGYLVFRRR